MTTILRNLLTLISSLWLSHLASALDYELIPPSQIIRDHSEAQFIITSPAPIKLGNLPAHPKIFWLAEVASRDDNFRGTDDHVLTVSFMATATGTIQFPPIPVMIGRESLLLRIDDIEVLPNELTAEDHTLTLLWDGLPETPDFLYVGQSVELIIKQEARHIEGRFGMTLPARQLEGVDWFVYTPRSGRRSLDEDYFRPFDEFRPRRVPGGFNLRFGGNPRRLRYQQSIEQSGDKLASTRQYQTRFTVGATDRLRGHLYASITTQRGSHVTVAPVDLPVRSLPPLEDETAIDTGLIGDWIIEGYVTPEEIVVKQPLKISVKFSGRGDPTLLRTLDLSQPGFATITTDTRFLNERNRITTRKRLHFQQELLPSGEAPVFPAVKLASFHPQTKEWNIVEITPPLTLKGASKEVPPVTSLTPVVSFGPAVQRPVLLNLTPSVFLLLALAPFIPILTGLLKSRLDLHDPEREARQAAHRDLITALEREDAGKELVDERLIPFLRNHYSLPPGATAREVASAVANDDPELSGYLKKHHEAAFSGQESGITLSILAQRLARLTMVFGILALIILKQETRAEKIDDANLSFAEKRYRAAATLYEELIEENPGHASLHLNLAKARLAAEELPRARAACHTALLLDPLDADTRDLMDQILVRLGQPTLPGSRLLALRPDQLLFLAVLIWVMAFIFFGLKKLLPERRLLGHCGLLCLILAFATTGAGFWRNAHSYAPEQFMVLAEELPREPIAGTPNWDFPALRSGQIVRLSGQTKTHGQVITPDTSFWLPLKHLQQVW